MQISNPIKCNIALIVFLFSISNLFAQSKMEYGISLGVNYGDFHETSTIPESLMVEVDRAGLAPYIGVRCGYHLTETTKIHIDPGFSFHLVTEDNSGFDFTSVYLEIPINIQHKLIGKLSALGGIQYQYLVNQSLEIDGDSVSRTELAESRNYLGMQAGLSYTIGSLAEIILSAHQNFNRHYTYFLTNSNGDTLGDVGVKNRFIRLAVVFRK